MTCCNVKGSGDVECGVNSSVVTEGLKLSGAAIVAHIKWTHLLSLSTSELY